MARWTLLAFALALVISACTSSEPIDLDRNTTTTGAAASSSTGAPTTASSTQLPIVFDMPLVGLDSGSLARFVQGQDFFNEVWTPVGPGETGSDGLGPLFNADSCAVCHPSTGRRQVPPDGALTNVGLVVRLSVPGADPTTGAPLAEPVYGDQLQDRAIGANLPEGTVYTNYVTQRGSYPDGTEFEILWPTVNVRNRNFGQLSDPTLVSARIGAQLIGMGFLEAIAEDDILANVDAADSNGDGISGRPNMVWNPKTNRVELGRFGWKANVVELDQQIAQAFHGDLGVTSTLIPDENCAPGQSICDETTSGGSAEVSDDKLDAITGYLRLLDVPTLRSTADADTGREVFRDVGCAACHIETFTTSASSIPQLSEQEISPYTDLLLHDMGFDMSDDRPDYAANGNEWRTPPLWGLGLVPVDGDRGLLHDGRARTIEEAILWHGGEAARSRTAFMSRTADDRALLLAFLESL